MKRNWTKGLLGLIGALALALPLTMGQTTHAADTDTTTPDPNVQTVILTKYGFSSAPAVTDHQTDQTPTDAHNGWAKDGTPLAGVKFAVYDVTSQYWADPTNYKGTAVTPEMTPVKNGTGTTNADGQITFTDLPTTSGDHNAVYLFHEVQARTGYDDQSSKDFWISLPAAAAGDNNVYVYPKNTQKTTYWHKFTKKDSHTGLALNGAQFNITNADGKYLAVSDEDGTLQTELTGWTNTEEKNFKLNWTTKDQATTFISGDDKASGEHGIFGLNGFTDQNADYTAIEIKAPAGYTEKEDPTPFTADNKTSDILDAPRGLLPHTGGTGILMILAVGAALLALAFVGIKKRQNRA